MFPQILKVLCQTSSPELYELSGVIKDEYLANYHENISHTHVDCNILTIFLRISHLLGEELARIILCDDKTSNSGSSMLTENFYQAFHVKFRRLGR